MRGKLSLLRVLAVVAAALLSLSNLQAKEAGFTIGTGGAMGIYYPAGGALCRIVNDGRNDHGFVCRVQSTGGSIANIEGLRAGAFDLAIVQSDIQFNAANGLGEFSDQAHFEELRGILSLHAEPATIVARSDIEIADVTGLKRRRVDIGNPESGTWATWKVIEQALGWRRRDLAGAYGLGTNRVGPALCSHDIDAFVVLVGHPSALVLEAIASCGASLLPIPNEVLEPIIAESPYYQAQRIPGGMYPGNPDDIATFGVAATLLAASDTPDALVYAVAKAVLANVEQFKALHPALKNLDPEEMVSAYMSVQLHPAAERAYSELGLME